MKIASFDLEIAKEVPEDAEDWDEYWPFGISCAAVATDDGVKYFAGSPQLSVEQADKLVVYLMELMKAGYTIVTVNGTGFDFRVLAKESCLPYFGADLALNHCDLMLLVTFRKGHYLSLDAMLKGAGLKSKRHHVKLMDGTIIENMSGVLAPTLWKQEEYWAVLDYLEGDVVQPLKLAKAILETGEIRWISQKGKFQRVKIDGLQPVYELYDLPEVDNSWMENPPTREQFISWIGEDTIEELRLHGRIKGEYWK